MGNNAELTSIRIGRGVFDLIIWTLMDVMHVPCLQRNLTSLGALHSKDSKCTIAGGVMNVVKEALVYNER